MGCGVGHRSGSDLALLWLWCRLAATAPIGPLAWKPAYAAGVALKRKKKISGSFAWNSYSGRPIMCMLDIYHLFSIIVISF